MQESRREGYNTLLRSALEEAASASVKPVGVGKVKRYGRDSDWFLMIKTKSIYHDPKEPDDGYRLLVMRYWPRGVRKAQVDDWLRDVAPSAALLASYKRGVIDWNTFAADYRSQILDTCSGHTLLAQLEFLEEVHGTLTLLCHEDLKLPNSHCHREILKELLHAQGHRAHNI